MKKKDRNQILHCRQRNGSKRPFKSLALGRTVPSIEFPALKELATFYWLTLLPTQSHEGK